MQMTNRYPIAHRNRWAQSIERPNIFVCCDHADSGFFIILTCQEGWWLAVV